MAVATPQASLRVVIAGFDLGVLDAIPLELQLRNAYLRVLNRLVREAAARLARTAITASAVPDPTEHAATWHLPNIDEVLPADTVKAQLLAATQPVRVKIVTHMMGGALASAGVGFDVTNPLAQDVLGQMGKRITDITSFTRVSIMTSLQDSHAAGLSIPHAARAMASKVSAANVSRATLIARTEFIGAQNASSLAAVAYTGAATQKVWLATSDERTRPDHADASGQTVPLSDPFDVGGNPMQHPGDQNAPAEEVCNCRCTMTYEGGDEESSGGGGGLGLPGLDLGGGETGAEAADVQGFDAAAFNAFEKAHPAGSHRNLYKGVTSTSGGHKIGLVKILDHDPLFGTKVEDVATGKIHTLEPTHSLKVPKPKKPEPIASADTSPLIPSAHAAPPGELPKIGDHIKLVNDAGSPGETAYPITGFSSKGNPVVTFKAGEKDVSVEILPSVSDYKIVPHPAGGEGIPAQALSVGDITDADVFGEPVKIHVDEIHGDVVEGTVSEGEYEGAHGSWSLSDLTGKTKAKAPTLPTKPKAGPGLPKVGVSATNENGTYTVTGHTPDGKIMVKSSFGSEVPYTPEQWQDLVLNAKSTSKAPVTTTDLKPAAPTGTFEVKVGQVVKFDNGYDPAHPYGSVGAQPVDGGTGIVTGADYSTNQVMVQKANGEIVQTHMSKITNNVTGQKADWKVGGGHPTPTTYTTPEQATSFATHKQEYLPAPKALTAVKDGHDFVRAIDQAQHAANLDRDALSAVRDYTGSSYAQLNRSLRETRGQTVPAMAKQMDKAFREIPATKVNGVLYRGTNLSNVPSAQNLRIGQVIHDDGFVSTSSDESATFSGDKMIIEVPKGSKVIDVNATSGSMHPGEREVLLNRGARFLVTKIEHRGAGYNRVIHVRLLLPKDYAKVTDTPPG